MSNLPMARVGATEQPRVMLILIWLLPFGLEWSGVRHHFSSDPCGGPGASAPGL